MLTNPEVQIETWRRAFESATSRQPHLSAFTGSWPLAYVAHTASERAVADARTLAELAPGDVTARILLDEGTSFRLTVYVGGRSMSLGEMLPALQSLDLDVVTEQPYELSRPDGLPCWIYDFAGRIGPDFAATDDAAQRIEQTLLAAWANLTDVDQFNRLVSCARLEWKESALIRAYAQYMNQLGVSWDRNYIASCLAAHPDITHQLVALFHHRFQAGAADASRARDVDAAAEAIEHAIDAVENLTADHVLRACLGLITSTVRTNFYTAAEASGREAIALKLAPRDLEIVPTPRPLFEVWVSSPRIEGIHLRFGEVARGGLRWSDRHGDLRTEILGLATAQLAKNAVIVPTGAKGGFVLKQRSADSSPPKPLPGYQEFVSALLDVHDNLDPTTHRPILRPDVISYEGTDAYLVVAADKGTASFSDSANAIAIERGFWLGDAFASGGSAGYDHKAIGITARGAWRSIERHFRELGINPDQDVFTAVGIGDMSGDVFGNGMLLSNRLKLIAAFDHRHIFLDPDPDPSNSFVERQRLFDLPRSSWSDYTTALISAGGGVYSRAAKSVPISVAVAEVLGIEPGTSLPPAELIRAILSAPVDLLWNGGIGTYVKASSETDRDAGDKLNDAVRITAEQLRARVVAEGGNLGLTQRARIEYARRGGRINTDAIDNSAGVGCSDREVNMKIALARLAASPELGRERLLESMTGEVCDLVLAENTSQNDLLGQSRSFAASDANLHARILDTLEESLGLDRGQLALPSNEEIAHRVGRGEGLSSPELAALTSQVKRDLRNSLIGDSLIDDPVVAPVLLEYFPSALRVHGSQLASHPLRREIIATELTNRIVNNAGLGFVHRMRENANASAGDAVRAFMVMCEIFDLPRIWEQIRHVSITTDDAERLLRESLRLLDSGSRWLLRNRPQPLDVRGEIARLSPTVRQLVRDMPPLLTATDRADIERRLVPVAEALLRAPAITREVFELVDRYCLLDIADLAQELRRTPTRVAEVYFLLKDRRRINALLADVADLPRLDRWSGLAGLGLHDDLYEATRAMCAAVLATDRANTSAEDMVEDWETSLGYRLHNIETVVEASRSARDLVHLGVAARNIRILAMLSGHGPVPDV